jgi:hypothetical protein
MYRDDQSLNSAFFAVLLVAAAAAAIGGAIRASGLDARQQSVQAGWNHLLNLYNTRLGALEALAKIEQIKTTAPWLPDEVAAAKAKTEALKTERDYSDVDVEELAAFDRVQGNITKMVRIFHQIDEEAEMSSGAKDILAQRDILRQVEADIAATRGKMISDVAAYHSGISDSWIAERHGYLAWTPIGLGH